MQMDVRRTDSEKINTLYQEFKKFTPEVSWYDNHAYLKFLNNDNQKFTTGTIYLSDLHSSVKCSFYTNVDNIRFDGDLIFTPEIRKEFQDFISHGTSMDAISYLKKDNEERKGSFERRTNTTNDTSLNLSSMEVTNGFCGTDKHLVYKILDSSNFDKIRNRNYLADDGTIKKVEHPSEFINKEIKIFTPLFCKEKGNKICSVCASVGIKKIPFGKKIKSLFKFNKKEEK